jgi:hypothetical protein
MSFGFVPSRIAPMSETVFHDRKGRATEDAFAAKSPAKLAAHTRLAERFVDEDEALLPDRAHEGTEDPPPLEIVWGVALYRDEGLVFRE